MRISFDSTLKVAGLGLAPWNRLGLERWFPAYKIASLYGWDVGAQPDVPEVLSLNDPHLASRLMKLNTAALLQTEDFQRLLKDKLAEYVLFSYKPVTVPSALRQRKFLMTDKTLANKFENKAEFRNRFSNMIRIPAYQIYDRTLLHADKETYETIMDSREAVILQDEQLSGGKGTFIIDSYEAYQKALATLMRTSQHTRIIVSSVVEEARERSIQGCVTKYGVFTGPLQRQIVRNPLLASTVTGEGNKFCGIQIIAEDQESAAHEEAKQIAQKVGEVLRTEGYKGIFGIDFLLDAHDVLYAIEINPRITGATPLLTALYGDETGIPFYLLHVLELGNYAYTIEGKDTDFSHDGASILIHSLEHSSTVVEMLPRSGTYRLSNGRLEYVSENISLERANQDEWVVCQYVPEKTDVKPGGRLLVAQTRNQIIDKSSDKLYNDTTKLISELRKHIVLTRTET